MLRQLLSFVSLLQLACVVTAQSSNLVRVCENLSSSQMCYDETRGRLVFRIPDGGVIEHDGRAWSRAVEGQPTGLPSLIAHCVYEASRDRVYLVDNEVREYDGNSIRSLGVAPSHSALCADSGRGRLVGIRSLGFLSGPMVVEEFDGSAWTQVATTPVGAAANSACYDPVLGKVVFCVTTYPTGSMPSQRQTFEWNGSFLNGPFAQDDLTPAETGSIAFDPVSRSVVGILVGAMVRWTGSAWTQMPTGGAPTRFSSLATDHRNGRILAYDSSTQTLHTYDGSWSSEPGLAPVCGSGAVLHDSVRGKTMLIGTRPSGNDARLLATYEQGEWEPIALDANAPSSFSGIASAFDEARGRLVLFGSALVNGQRVATTHAFDGASWRIVGGAAPAARTGAQLAYDSVRGRVVLMGGNAGGQSFGPSDHWEYDGIAWTQVAATTPVQRFYLSLGFDPARNRLVAHDYQGQTFELVAGTWTMVGKRGPTSTLNSALPMRYDPSRGGLLLRARGSSPSPTMHLWNGATWSQLGERVGDYAFDPVRGTTLIQDGTTTYLASYAHAATVASGSGCGSTADAPTLSAFRKPRIGDDELRLDLRADAALRPVILGFGLELGLLSLGHGCTFYLGESFASDVWFTDAYGFSSRPLAIPDVLELRGLQVHAQGCVLDPVAPLGFALSQALTLRIGD